MQKLEVKVKENSWLAKLAAWKLKADSCAIVFGKTIYLHRATKVELEKNTRWYKHELAHVQQWMRYGTVRFLVLYIFYSMKYGYYNNPFEVEAREAESK